MNPRFLSDHGMYRWITALCAAVLLTTIAPTQGEAQRKPRLLGTPVVQPVDSTPTAPTPPTTELAGTPVPGEEPQPVTLPAVADSRGAFPVVQRIEMRSTAYCLRGNMRTGVRVRDGMAAGDPSVLPLGSVVRVSHTDGRLIGIFVIMDTGGAVRGNKIDLWFDSCREASAWGSRRVVAEVLDIGRA